MTPDQLDGLWTRFQEEGDQAARETLLVAYEPLVGFVVRKVATAAPAWQDRADLRSYGYLGLIDAVDKFDRSLGVKFETYATRRIRGAILDGLRSEDPLTRNMRRQVKAVHSVIEEWMTLHGRPPSDDELACATGESKESLRLTLQMSQTVNDSLDRRLVNTHQSDGSDNEASVMQDREVDFRMDSPELASEISAFRDVLAEGLAQMGPRERTFVALYYGESLSLTDVGQQMGVSDARAGQIRLSVVTGLKSSM